MRILALCAVATSVRAASLTLFAASDTGTAVLTFNDAADKSTLTAGSTVGAASGHKLLVVNGVLYVLSGDGNSISNIAAFKADTTGSLSQLGAAVPSGGIGASDLAISSDGSTLAVANTGGASIATFNLNANGSVVGPPVSTIAFPNNGGPSSLAYDRSGSFVFATLQNVNTIGRLSSSSGAGALTSLANMDLMSDEISAGPKSIVFSGAAGPTRVFTLNSAANTIDTWAMCYGSGSLQSHQTSIISSRGYAPGSTTTNGSNSTTGAPAGLALALSPDGTILLAGTNVPGSNDTIASLSVASSVTQTPLFQLAITSVGSGLSSMAFDPTGALLAVSTSSSVTIYRVNSNGQLAKAASTDMSGIKSVVWTSPPATRMSSMTQLASACDNSTARSVGGPTTGSDGNSTTGANGSGGAGHAQIWSSFCALASVGLFMAFAL